MGFTGYRVKGLESSAPSTGATRAVCKCLISVGILNVPFLTQPFQTLGDPAAEAPMLGLRDWETDAVFGQQCHTKIP